jgi:Family of unknown function (DUF6807)
MSSKVLAAQLICFLLGSTCLLPTLGAAGNSEVKITDQGGKVAVEIGGKLFTEYHYQDVPRPYFYPVLGPNDLAMTRDWPMKEAENEEHDHKHHRSLWFTHGEVNGVDFWSEAEKVGKIVHDKFTEISSGKRSGVIRSQNKWVAPDGKIVCTDDRTFRVYAGSDERLFDFEVTVHASHGDLTFGDTKEGTMAIRLAETMRLKGKVGHGHIVNSNGVRDGDTWGKRADWVDYYGPVNGQTVGVAIFDHPQNPMHPTWWHVRDYGLFAANPFGVHDFESKPKGTGNFTVAAGKSATFRYRFYLHPGDDKQAKVSEHYREYVSSMVSK